MSGNLLKFGSVMMAVAAISAVVPIPSIAPANAQSDINSPSSASSIRGIVTNKAGQPVPGVTVEVLDTWIAVMTKPDGSFELPALPDGEYNLEIRRFGLATEIVPINIGGGILPALAVTVGPNTFFAKAAASYTPPAEPRLAQKAAYLASISKTHPTERPNVVVIFFDDLGYGDLSSYGNKLIKTPNIDKAAREGVRMTEFYSASPVCTPSRAALLSGRYPNRALAANHVFFPTSNPIATLRKSQGFANALPRDEILVSEILEQAGYHTALIGKWHLGDEAGHRPNDFGFGRFYGALYSNDMQPFEIYSDGAVKIAQADVQQGRLTGKYTDEAISFIDSAGDAPFFLYMAHTFPHVPHYANPETSGQSAAGLYGDVVEELDRSVGAVLNHLKDRGLDNNTLVIITSDNGGDFHASVGDLRGRKGEIFEGGMRVPMIARWPGHLPAGAERAGMAMNIDILPSLLDIIGLPLPGDRIIDGKNILPLLRGDAESPHDFLYYLQAWSAEPAAVRGPRFKFMDSIQKQSSHVAYPAFTPIVGFTNPMLTDLRDDNETHNLILTHPETARELEAKLKSFREASIANPRGWLAPATKRKRK